MFGSTITKFLKLDQIIDNLTGFAEARVELLKVEIKEDLAVGLARAVTYMLIFFAFAMMLLLMSFGAAILLSERFGALVGYGSVGGVYLLAGIILLAKRKQLIDSIEKKLTVTFKKKK